MKVAVIAIVGLVTGLIVGVFFTRDYSGRELLRATYLNSALDARKHLAVLKTPQPKEAHKVLEHFLLTSKIILEGCKVDLCAEEEIEEVAMSLKDIENYEFRHVSP